VDNDPIKRQLDEIEQDLEAAIANLNATNQRVDDLLTEYAGGVSTPRRPAELETADAAAQAPDTSDEPPPEY
jgi:hypothetical protein